MSSNKKRVFESKSLFNYKIVIKKVIKSFIQPATVVLIIFILNTRKYYNIYKQNIVYWLGKGNVILVGLHEVYTVNMPHGQARST
jgi:hypothetical protein